MITSICARCGRKHISDVIHSGRLLRCAGCGDAVQIGKAREEFAVGKQVLDGEVVGRPKGKWIHSFKWHRFSTRKYALAGALVMLALFIGGVLMARRTEHGPWQNYSTYTVPPLSGENARSTEPDPYADIAQTPSVPKARDSPQADPYESTMSTHITGDKVVSCPIMRGRGIFTFKNDSEEDAVVFLMANAKEVAASIYIRENENGVLRNFKPGLYWVKIAKGKGWDDDSRSFTFDGTYFKVPHPYRFTETEEKNGVRYSTVELTLYKVLDGNVEQESISKAEFAGS